MNRPPRRGSAPRGGAPQSPATPLRVPHVTPQSFQRLAAAAAGCYGLLVVTGGAVRLTGSGLGCPDWPTCYGRAITAPVTDHAWVEFSNRLVTVAVTVVTLVILGAAIRRLPRRRDLIALSFALVGGLLAQVVLGGLVVLFSLNPYLVSLHFVLTLAVLAVALVLWHNARASNGAALPLVGRDLVVLSRLVIVALGLLISIGTIVTGSGPHAGGPNAKRIGIAFRDIAELHSSVALFVIGLVLALLFALHVGRAPESVQRHARVLLELLAVQGAIGYTQYFLHDAALVVEFHLAGATSVWCAAVLYYLSLHRHPLQSELLSDPGVAEQMRSTLAVVPR